MADTETQKAVTVFESRHAETLVRIDERTGSLVASFHDFKTSTEKKIDSLKTEVNANIKALESRLDEKVSKEAFNPVRLVVWGMVGLILIAVVGGLLSNVVINKGDNSATITMPMKK